MNVALFPSAFHPSLGGVEELTRQLAHELRRQGHGVVVITNRWPRDLPERETVEGIDVVRLPMRFPAGSLKSWLTYHASRGAVCRKLATVLREARVDVLHVQCVSSQAHYASWAKRAMRLPFIVTLQGELTMDATQLYQRSERARGLMRQTLRDADAITACSAQTLQEAGSFMGEPWSVPATVIWNGVSVAEFADAPPYSHPRPYALAIGRHVKQKGFDVLIDAFASAGVQGGELDLILAGEGLESASLHARVAELGLVDRIKFVGRADRRLAASLFRGCAFFVLPSRHEPFGIVNLEAMASGKAVIATHVGGVAEVVKDGETGLLVPAQDAAELAIAMRTLSGDTSLRNRMAAAGSSSAASFDWSQIAAKYVATYEGVTAAATSEVSSAYVTPPRIEWWDTVKGIAIILIVSGHVISQLHFEGLATMPGTRAVVDVGLLGALAAFYFAAGAFLEHSVRRPFGRFAVSKAQALLLPYLAWTLLQGGAESAMSKYVVPDRTFGRLLQTLWYQPYWQFWFLYVLFMASIFTWVLRRTGISPVACVGVAIALHFAGPYIGVDWYMFQRLCADFVLVALGLWAGRRFPERLERASPLTKVAGGTAAVIGVIAGVHYPLAGQGPLLIGASCGWLICLSTQAITGLRVASGLAFIGRHSLAIFCMHVFIIGGLKVVLTRLLPHSGFVVQMVARTVFGIALPVTIAVVWQLIVNTFGGNRALCPSSPASGRLSANASRELQQVVAP